MRKQIGGKENSFEEKEREREGWGEGREIEGDWKKLEKIGTHIKFNLNQPSFINITRIPDMFHQKLDTCAWLDLFPSLFISLSHVVLASLYAHRPRCLFTSRLYYFCHAHPRVCRLFRSNDRSSHESISLRMRLECLEGPDMSTNGSVPATRSLTTRCSVIVAFEWKEYSLSKTKIISLYKN